MQAKRGDNQGTSFKYLSDVHLVLEKEHRDAAITVCAEKIHFNNYWDTYVQDIEDRETRIAAMTAYNTASAMCPPSRTITPRERAYEYSLQHPPHFSPSNHGSAIPRDS